MSTLSVFDAVGVRSVLGGFAGGSFGSRSRFESESWKRATRRSLLGFSLLFLVACDDDDDDGGGSSREAMDSPAPPEARNEGEVIVSFTLTGVDNVTQLSGADFQVTAKKVQRLLRLSGTPPSCSRGLVTTA